jgi:glutamyl-tRNA reductase
MGEPEPRLVALVAAAPAIDASRREQILPLAEAAAAKAGGVLVSTCHRVEWLADDDHGAPVDLEWLTGAGMACLQGRAAASHVINLALGLESAVVGEDQILHQLRTAVTAARQRGALGRSLDPLLDHALRAGRLGRSWRPTHPSVGGSLADVAVLRIQAVIGRLTGRRILVVGAGEMGRAAASAAVARGASVVIASQSKERTADAASELGVVPSSMDPGAELLEVDGVVVALSGPWRMTQATADALASRAMVVDLSMPPALPAGVRARLGDRLVDIDGLAAVGHLDGMEARYRARLEGLAERTLSSYLTAIAERQDSAADRLAKRIEHERARELEAYLRHRPELDAADRAMIDEATRDVSHRLFREPLARLASDPDGRRRRALDELFGA